jgi:RNA polymerase sigma factor (sigma-70 family)
MEAASIQGRARDGARRVEAMVTRHGPALLRVANQFSLCHDDALDAYQRALEIYLRHLDRVDPATEGAWLRVVVKHEAMAIRQSRQESVAREAVDLDDTVSALREVDEAVASGERVERSVEALRALKPDEAKALMLKAQGLSYQEIGRRFGWTYTKVCGPVWVAVGRARSLRTAGARRCSTTRPGRTPSRSAPGRTAARFAARPGAAHPLGTPPGRPCRARRQRAHGGVRRSARRRRVLARVRRAP